jgi:hypothetical protein
VRRERNPTRARKVELLQKMQQLAAGRRSQPDACRSPARAPACPTRPPELGQGHRRTVFADFHPHLHAPGDRRRLRSLGHAPCPAQGLFPADGKGTTPALRKYTTLRLVHGSSREGRNRSCLLYERTGLSKNKKAVIERARRQEPQESIADMLRDPYVLEFTGLAERPEFSEDELETALLDHVQRFLWSWVGDASHAFSGAAEDEEGGVVEDSGAVGEGGPDLVGDVEDARHAVLAGQPAGGQALEELHFQRAQHHPLRFQRHPHPGHVVTRLAAGGHHLGGDQLAERRMSLELTDAARDLLAESGWEPAYGARPLKRAIQRMVFDPLARRILGGDFGEGDTVLVDYPSGAESLTFTKAPPAAKEAGSAAPVTGEPAADAPGAKESADTPGPKHAHRRKKNEVIEPEVVE